MESPNSKNQKSRPPVVVIMGHVDHGKTTLLDYIRKANVAGREAGGITQAVGAYEISHNDRKITFIDTPGHEAFSKMRSRGAEVADLAVLVIAADEGMKPQTKEAIEILNQAKTPFVVAINKIDKTGGDLTRARNDLAAAGVYLEGFGGQVSYHGISAKTGEGVNELIDLIILAADMENLMFDPAAPAGGYVLEVHHDSRRGIETSVIITEGTLKRGQSVHTPTAIGKVKILENFLGKIATELESSAPALILGFETLPKIGELFSTTPFSGSVPEKSGSFAKKPVASGKSDVASLNFLLKASDAGSLEVLSAVIRALAKEEKPLHVIQESVGDITDGDVKDAIATGAHIIGFKVKVQKGARNLADAHVVSIVTSEIIYDLVKAVQEFFATLGKPPATGELEVLAVFNQKRETEQLAGGRVTLGMFRAKATVEIIRVSEAGMSKTEGSGKILTLREKKTSIDQAGTGKEIGLVINSPLLIKVGDRLIIRR